MNNPTNLPKVLTNDFSPTEPATSLWEGFHLSDATFEAITLDGITLRNAKWKNVFVNAKNCHIQNAQLEAWRVDDGSFLCSRFTQTTLKNCTFLKTSLSFANFEQVAIENLNMIDGSLQGTVFKDAAINAMVIHKNTTTTKLTFDQCRVKLIYNGLCDGNFIVKDGTGFVIFAGIDGPTKLFNKSADTAYFHIPNLNQLLKKQGFKLTGKHSFQTRGEAYLTWLNNQTLESLTQLTDSRDASKIEVQPGEVFPLKEYLFSLRQA